MTLTESTNLHQLFMTNPNSIKQEQLDKLVKEAASIFQYYHQLLGKIQLLREQIDAKE